MAAKISNIVILLLVIGHIVKAEEYKCKPKPGCHFSRCDPPRTVSFGILQEREYSILCESTGKGSDSVSRQEYNELQTTLRKTEEELASVKNDSVSKQEYIELQTALRKTEEELALVKKDIETLKKEATPNIARSSQPEKGTVDSGEPKVTPTPKLQENKPKGKGPNAPCGLKIGTTCLFLARAQWATMNYFQAKAKCEAFGASLALITGREMYNTLFQTFRQTPGNWDKIFWTGMFYDPVKKIIEAPDAAYEKWAFNFPTSDKDDIHIALRINSNPAAVKQGMMNVRYRIKLDSVLCQWFDE